MGILIIILLFVLAVMGLWLLFKILKWCIQRKRRTLSLFVLLIGVGVSITVYQVYFVKMKFVQSKVYPDLYLVKNPIKNKDSLYKAIKEEVAQHENIKKLRFYEYSKGDFLENGTAYFLEHKEKSDGMFSELLEYYPNYLLATFKQKMCSNNQEEIEIIHFYNKGKEVKTDTLFNNCSK